MSISASRDRNGVLVRALLARLQVALVDEETRNAFGLAFKNELPYLPECILRGDSDSRKVSKTHIGNFRHSA